VFLRSFCTAVFLIVKTSSTKDSTPNRAKERPSSRIVRKHESRSAINLGGGKPDIRKRMNQEILEEEDE
jgi:hypothetical protein